MSTESKRKPSWVQCQTCGTVYKISRSIPIEELYVAADCPKCGITIGLNLGDTEDDIYLYMCENVDPRYY